MELIKGGNSRYDEYEALLLDRDQARKEAGQTWTLYLKTFGKLIADIYEMKIECIKRKKTIAYYQNAINHGGVIDADAMQAYLQSEMAGYYAKLEEMLADNEKCSKSGTVTLYEAGRSKTLYRRLAKLIHPDINPETDRNEKLMELWQRIVNAYGRNDIKELSELEVIVRKALSELGLGCIQVEIPGIDEKIAELEKEIGEIKTTEPYTYRRLLDDSEAVARRKKELTAELDDYTKYRDQLGKVIDDLLAGGRITLKWKMK